VSSDSGFCYLQFRQCSLPAHAAAARTIEHGANGEDTSSAFGKSVDGQFRFDAENTVRRAPSDRQASTPKPQGSTVNSHAQQAWPLSELPQRIR